QTDGQYFIRVSNDPGSSGEYFLSDSVTPITSVGGNVYDDLNGNGQQNPGEPGLEGWTVDLLDANGTIVASAVSDPNGEYSLAVLPGTYRLVEEVQTGWAQTQPLNPNFYSFTIQTGQDLTFTFGDHSAPVLSPVRVVDNGQPGYSE